MKSYTDNPVILFDGLCILCEGSINFLIRMDKKKILRYASLQSEMGKRLIKEFNLSSQYDDSVILIVKSKSFLKSDAALEIIKIFGGFWRLLFFFKIIPKKMRDSIYDFIARNRYQWFGRKDCCIIPDQSVKELFLDL